MTFALFVFVLSGAQEIRFFKYSYSKIGDSSTSFEKILKSSNDYIVITCVSGNKLACVHGSYSLCQTYASMYTTPAAFKWIETISPNMLTGQSTQQKYELYKNNYDYTFYLRYTRSYSYMGYTQWTTKGEFIGLSDSEMIVGEIVSGENHFHYYSELEESEKREMINNSAIFLSEVNSMSITGGNQRMNSGSSSGNSLSSGSTEQSSDRYGDIICPSCKGGRQCATCNGKGYYLSFGNYVSCPNCTDGTCKKCNGKGTVWGLKSLNGVF